MALPDPPIFQKNREWRRCVRVKARIKSSEGWRDAAILNISSRGLLIHSACCSKPGGEVELRGGDQVIWARVVWRRGARAGLRSETVLPMLDIINLTEGRTGNLALDEARQAGRCTRPTRTPSVEFSQWNRLLELGSVLAIATITVFGFVSMGAELVFARLGEVTAALPG